MRFKKIITSAVAAASLFAFTGMASAWEINIYGASAQYKFWKSNGAAFLTSKGCTGINQATGPGDGVCFQATCPAVDPFGAGGVGTLCANSKASYDGCYAAKGESRTGTAAPGRVTDCDPNYNQRPMPSGCTFPGTCSTTTCKTIHIGASDVPCECFTQETHGYEDGPTNTGGWKDLKFDRIDMSGIPVYRPMVVTFAPFANLAVTKGTVPITNITRDNMELIFSGQVADWGDIADTDGVPYDAGAMYVCLRHAGSGTHASLDAYLNSPLISYELDGVFEFTKGTSQMMTCINQQGVKAIGYADADRTPGTNTVRLMLNGVGANLGDIADANVYGNYNFYGVQHLYGAAAASLAAYLDNCTNIPAPFNAESELIYTRTGENACDPCGAFPLGYRGGDLSCIPH